jgi:hypothetical protein
VQGDIVKLRFQATFDIEQYRKRGIMKSEDLVILKHDLQNRERIQKELYKIVEKNETNFLAGREPVELDVTIDIAYRPRSVKANALMWTLYGIIADVLNRENGTREKVTAQSLYDDDMKEWAPRHIIACPDESLVFFKMVLENERGKAKSITPLEGKAGFQVIEIWQTSSYWDTKQMGDHINRLLNTLESMGVIRENNGDLDKVFSDFEKWEKDNGNTEN